MHVMEGNHPRFLAKQDLHTGHYTSEILILMQSHVLVF